MVLSADSARVACPLFQTGDGGSTPTSALQLHVFPCNFLLFERLNQQWHSRLPHVGAYYTNGLFFAAAHDDIYYAVAGWSAPIALTFNGLPYLELRRLAISSDAPKNTASRLLAIMARLIHQARPGICKLISYQDTAVHTGTIYKAAGWHATRISKAEEQNWVKTHPRASSKLQTTSAKVRWERDIQPQTAIQRPKKCRSIPAKQSTQLALFGKES